MVSSIRSKSITSRRDSLIILVFKLIFIILVTFLPSLPPGRAVTVRCLG
nr:MAG TPA: hypothetical protein [Caudoviricetes sp.]